MGANEPPSYHLGKGELRDTIDHPQATAPTANNSSDPTQAKTPKTRQPRRTTSPVLMAVRAALHDLGIARPKTRPFYRRWWFRAPAVLAVLLIFGAANNFGDPSTTTSSASRQSGAGAPGGTALAQAAPVATPALPTDQGWVLDSYRLQNHVVGDFGGTVRITNTNKAAQSAVFTILMLVKGREVASLQGSVDSAAPGRTVTVQLTSQDKYKSGTYAIDFQAAVTHY